MLRIILISTSLLMLFILIYGLFNRQNENFKNKTPLVEVEIQEIKKAPKCFEEFNSINSKIKGFTCDDVKITVEENGISNVAHGNIRYEKEKKFRMIIKGLLGKEMDLGSNDKIFWFWAKRSDEKGLFWAKHEDFYKTRLKTPFNPVWIMGSLGVDEIKDEKIISFLENGVVILTKNSFNQEILVKILINKENRLESMITTDLNDRLLISVFVLEYVGPYPKEINYIWHEENRTMKMSFKNPREIGLSNVKLWEIPNIKPKIDMSVN